MFWIQPIWFGRDAGDGTGRIPILNEEIGVPVHTKLIDRLREELPDVEVWPDMDRSSGNVDSIVVENQSGDWSIATTSWQRRSRTMRVTVSSPTSDGAERLINKVAMIIRGSGDFLRLITAHDVQGGYDDDNEVYYRGAEFTFKARTI